MSEAQIWNRLAGRYDTIVKLFNTSYPKVQERIAQDIPPDGVILEVAAGTGQFTRSLAARASSLVATDISPNMVESLRAMGKAAGLSHMEARVMSAYDIPEEDGHFDAIFCANALHVMDDPKRALHQFRRVLGKEGILIVPTFLHGTSTLRRGLSRGLSLVSPFVATPRFDMKTLQALIEETGFKVQYTEVMPGFFPLGYLVATPS